jgi:uncharacterized protein YxjI
MGTNYLISRKWALSDRFAITDDTGVPQFDVHGRFAFSRKLSLRDSAGTEVAVIIRRGWPMRYEVLAGGQLTTVRPRGFLGKRFEIDSPAGVLEARGNFSGRQYSVTRGGAPVVAVTQLRTFREQFSAEVCDGEDALLMLAVVLAIETIREDRGGQCNCPGRQLMPPTRSRAKSRSRRQMRALRGSADALGQ